jgi:tetratricopeptide (TPR) repeat protein
MTVAPGRRARLIGGLVVAAVTVAAHWPAVHGEFLFDDVGEIGENPAIRTLWPPWVPMFAGGNLAHRPLPSYTFALNHALGGLEPFGYHLVNLAIHLGNGWLVWWIAKRLLEENGPARNAADGHGGEPVAWAGAAIWLVHPLVTQAVDYVYQRMELLGATAILATLACFLQARRSAHPRRWLAASVAASGCGMLCKETVVAAPAVVFLVDWLAGGRPPWRPWGAAVATLRRRPTFYAASAATLLVAVWVVAVQRERFAELVEPVLPAWRYAINQPLVILDYLRLAAWPAGLCLDRYRLPAADARPLVAGMVAVAAALAIAVGSLGRRPRVALTMLLFFALLAPTSSLIPVNDLQVDHRMYLPLAVLVVGTLAAVASRVPPRAFAIGAVCGGAVLALATHARSAVFASRLAAWRDVVTKAPANPRGRAILADELLRHGDAGAALVEVDASLAIEPRSARPHLLRSAILFALDRHEESLAAARMAVEQNPRVAGGHVRVAAALVELDRHPEAITAARAALTVDAGDVPALRLLAEALVWEGRDAEALDACRRMFALDPPDRPLHAAADPRRHGLRFATLAAALAGLRAGGAAAAGEETIDAALARAEAFDPSSPRTTRMRALALRRLGR